MIAKLLPALLLVSGALAKNVPKDLATDIQVAQGKLGACIQEILQFESTYQIITNADISIEVSDQFSEVFLMMGLIDISPAVIEQISDVAAQDLIAVQLANRNLLDATNEFLSSAYKLNENLRNNTLGNLPDLLVKFSQTDVELFNEMYTEFSQTVSFTGNTVEILILAAIGTTEGVWVSNIYAMLQNINDIVNASFEHMGKELVTLNHDLSEAIVAVDTVVQQIPVVY